MCIYILSCTYLCHVYVYVYIYIRNQYATMAGIRDLRTMGGINAHYTAQRHNSLLLCCWRVPHLTTDYVELAQRILSSNMLKASLLYIHIIYVYICI